MKRVRKRHRYPAPDTATLFGEDELVSPDHLVQDGDLERDVQRMRLETSSGVYAQRRSQW